VKTNPDRPIVNDPAALQARLRRLLPVFFGLLAFASVAATINDPGPTWDEPTYLVASEAYVDWLSSPSLSAEAIEDAWTVNHEHPPLAKIWMGVVRRAVQFIYPGFPNLIASRLATAMLFGALIGLVCAAGLRMGAVAGISAAIFALLMPRLFAHAHFAALDLPIALAWFATACAFERGMTSRKWAVAAGVIFGAALLTKINAVFIPLPLFLWAALAYRKKAIVPAVLLLGVGAAVFLAGWPWLWHETLPRLEAYFLGTTLGRAAVPVYYLGDIYAKDYAPWHYPLVLTLLTIPVGVLVCLALGLRGGFRPGTDDRPVPQGWRLAAFNFAAILLLATLPWSPRYDGVRLFLPLFPYAALLAGFAFQGIWDWWGQSPWRLLAACVFVALQALGVFLYDPYQTSYYNLLCGGLPGAQKLGLETTYWGDVYSDPVFEYVNNLPEGSQVAFYPIGAFVNIIYQGDGYLSGKITYADFKKDDFDYAVLMAREGWLLQDERAARLFREGEPLLEIKRLGVTLCVVKAAEHKDSTE